MSDFEHLVLSGCRIPASELLADAAPSPCLSLLSSAWLPAPIQTFFHPLFSMDVSELCLQCVIHLRSLTPRAKKQRRVTACLEESSLASAVLL